MKKIRYTKVKLCPTCGAVFNCKNCKRLEKHELQYFRKGTVINVDSRIS